MHEEQSAACTAADCKMIEHAACQECHVRPFLYTCPRCHWQTCSLSCCVTHKQRTGCNGKRDRTTYVRVGQMDDSTLYSDYAFLQEMQQAVQFHQQQQQQQQHQLHQQQGQGQRQQPGRNPLLLTASQAPNNQNSAACKRTKHQHGGHSQLGSSSNNNNQSQEHPILANSQRREPFTSVGSFSLSSPPPPPPDARFRQFHSVAYQERGVRILWMPIGMERHAQHNRCYVQKSTKRHNNNSSNHNERNSATVVLYWSVEWILHHDQQDLNQDDITDNRHHPREESNECSLNVQSVQRNRHDRQHANDQAHSIMSGNNNNIHNTRMQKNFRLVSERDDLCRLIGTIIDQMSKTLLPRPTSIPALTTGKSSANDIGCKGKELYGNHDRYHVLIPQLPCPAHQPVYFPIMDVPISINDDSRTALTLQDILQGRTVIEFPTLHIVPHNLLSRFRLVVQPVDVIESIRNQGIETIKGSREDGAATTTTQLSRVASEVTMPVTSIPRGRDDAPIQDGGGP